jgi:large subunit ribosomal protein L17
MRHRKKKNKLSGRSRSHLRADVLNMVNSLILNERIRTTKTRARLVSSKTEVILRKTLNQKGPIQKKQTVHRLLNHPEAEKKLLKDTIKKLESRSVKSGYTRLTKVGYRKGDNAELFQVELIS